MIRHLLILVFLLFVTPVSWAAGGMSGAYAVNPDVPGQYGFTFNRNSREQAEKIALQRCGDGCEIVDVFSGGCGAYAIDEAQDGLVLGYASASSANEAKTAAVKNCEARGGTACKLGKSGCNGRRPGRSR